MWLKWGDKMERLFWIRWVKRVNESQFAGSMRVKRALKSGRGGQKSQRWGVTREEGGREATLLALKMEKGDHEPKTTTCSLWKLIPLQSLQEGAQLCPHLDFSPGSPSCPALFGFRY